MFLDIVDGAESQVTLAAPFLIRCTNGKKQFINNQNQMQL